ncbi:MAG: MoaD/ThiS family protein [Nitrosomonadales bacterium]|nr:MoaD/ThiS family protein [Nitrosomonadales bacterium]
MIRILFFGPVAEQVAVREMQLEFHAGMRLMDVASHLQARYAEAFRLVSFIAVNSLQTKDMQLGLSDGDEIAFMAKFSGG